MKKRTGPRSFMDLGPVRESGGPVLPDPHHIKIFCKSVEIKMSEGNTVSSSLEWGQTKCNPSLFQGSQRTPFIVPVEQISSWTERGKVNYKVWLAKGSKNTRDDFRKYLLSLNEEFNMDDVFDSIDVGLEAFDKLVQCLKTCFMYDLNKDLENMNPKESEVFNYFIWCGVRFVKTYPYDCES